jgi:hypothetical protein
MKKQTKTTTFRISEDCSNELKIISEENQTSTNTLVNQIIETYVSIEKPMKQYGIVKISSDLFLELFNNLNETIIKKIGKSIGSKEPKEFIQYKWNIITRGTVLEFLTLYCNYCGFGDIEINTTNEKIRISINHGLGEKFSIYFQSFLEAMFQTTLNKTATFNVRKNMILMTILEN